MNTLDELVTIDEQIKIVKRARSLIWEPTSWVQGSWKCELVTPDGVMGKTENGTPRYQYCVEGALNQATYDVLGEERALALGAVVFNSESGLLEFKGAEDEIGHDPAKLFGLDDLARSEFGCESAMEYNDSEPDYDEDNDEYYKNVHQGVVGMLSTKLSQLLGRKEAAA